MSSSSAASAPLVSITALPLFEDNYAWRLDVPSTGLSVVVDAADAPAVLASLAATPAQRLAGVLTTHHHADHSGGNAALAAALPGLPVLGGAAEELAIPAATRLVADGEVVELAGLRFTCLHTPCHTKGHVCYVLAAADSGLPHDCVFTGDTLFAAGCGRFFEGTAAQMRASLARLAALAPETRVYCGHEYTVSNLHFCLHVEPGNARSAARLAEATAARAAGRPTLPSTIADELETNVFMRTAAEPVRAWAGAEAVAAGEDAVMARLREAKNGFKAPK